MKKGNGRLLITIAISGLAVVTNYFINFFTTPFIMDNIGMEAYGFVSIARTAINYADIITVALTSFVVRFISIAHHEGRVEESRAYYSSSVFATIILSVGIFLCALIPISVLEKLLVIPEELVHSVKLLFVVTFVNFVITTISTPVSSAVYITDRLDLSGWFRIAGHILHAVALLALFWLFTPTVWFVPLSTMASTLFVLLCNYVYKSRRVKYLRFAWCEVSFKRISSILKNGIWNSLNSLGNVLNSGLDLIISNLMLTGTAMGQIAVAQSIGAYFSILYETVFQPFQPRLLKLYASEDRKPFLNALTKAMTICGCFSNVALAGFFSLGRLYYDLWLPNQDGEMLYLLTMITVFLSITAGAMKPIYYVYTLTLKNKLPCYLTIASGVLNVAAKFVLLQNTTLGPIIVVVTTTVIMICMNLFFNPVYAAKCLKIKVQIFYHVIIRHILSALLMMALFALIANLLHPQGWLGLLGSAAVMCVVGIPLHFGICWVDRKLFKK